MSSLYSAYENLPDPSRLLVEILALVDQPISRSAATRQLNVVLDRSRAKRVNVKNLIDDLVASEILEDDHRGNIFCESSILEDVAAAAGRRGTARQLLSLLTVGSRTPLAIERRRWHAASPERTGEAFITAQALELLSVGISQPATLDAFPERIGLELVGRILARALTWAEDRSPFLAWLESRVGRADCPILAYETYGHLCLLRGEESRIEPLLEEHPNVLAFFLREILRGNTATGVHGIAEQIAAAGQHIRFPILSQEFLYLVGCLMQQRHDLLEARVRHAPSEVNRMMSQLALARDNKSHQLPPTHSHHSFEIQLAAVFCHYWSGREQTISTNQVQGLAQTFEAGGYLALSQELRSLLAYLEGKTAAPQGRLLGLLEPVSTWASLLDKLEGWSQGKKEPPAQSQMERVVWMVQFDYEDLPASVYPKLQRASKAGGWTKGKRLPLGKDTRMDDHDLAVLRACQVRSSYSFLPGLEHHDPVLALRGLVGHPRVFDDRQPDRQLHFGAASPRLWVTNEGSGLRVRLDLGREAHQDIAIRELQPGHYGICPLDGRLRELRDLIGAAGARLPAESLERAGRTLSQMLGEELEIAGELPLALPDAIVRESDLRLRVRLSPYQEGLRWAVRVVPDQARGEAFVPGEGPPVQAYSVAGQVYELRRDLVAEREVLAELYQAVPLLAEEASFSLELRTCLQLLEALQGLGSERVLVEWPQGQPFRLRQRVGGRSLQLRAAGRDDWFELEGELRLEGEETLALADVLQRLRDDGHYLQLEDGSYLALSEELRRRLALLQRVGEEGEGGGFRLPWLSAPLLQDDLVEGDSTWQTVTERIQRALTLPVELPGTLSATLRDYQEEGYRWLARAAEWGAGVCLADDMGLGKTVQTLALLLRRAGDGPALVVAPTSVGANWIDEARRFAPDLRTYLYSESEREMVLEQAGPGDLIVLSYGLLVRDQEALRKVRWSTVVLDESQAIKNSATQRFKAAVSLPAGFRMATTGTPVENHLEELWALFRFLNPTLLGSKQRFSQRFGAAVDDPIARAALSVLVRPFILRRLKSQVLQELPARTEITLKVELSRSERIFYEGLRLDSLQRLEDAGPLKLFTILVELTKLRRACCHPGLVKGGQNLESSKLYAFARLLTEIVESGHRVLVFSQFVDHLKLAVGKARELGLSYRYLDGSTPLHQRRKAVAEFQAEQAQVFFVSLKAGGFGLNLTAATYVIHLDPWWNPAVEDQASDRAHRMGQQQPVTIYRLIASDTIEEKILRLHQDKRELADQLLAGTDQTAGLDAEQVLGLLKDSAFSDHPGQPGEENRPAAREKAPTLGGGRGESQSGPPVELKVARPEEPSMASGEVALEQLALGKKVARILRERGCRSLSDVLEQAPRDLRGESGFGAGGQRELQQAIRQVLPRLSAAEVSRAERFIESLRISFP
jgi:superfamily II DNA or RNA helicase